MKNLRFILWGTLFLAAFLNTACTTKYASVDGVTSKVAVLERSQKICMVSPADGRYGEKIYIGSGRQTLLLIKEELRPYVSDITVVQGKSTEAVLVNVKGKECKYLFYPVITNWEPRVAAWSARPTRVAMSMDIYDLKNNNLHVMQKNLYGTGRSATWVSQNPEEILRELLKQFALEIYSAK